MEGLLEQVLEHPKSPDFIDAAASGFTYDSLAGLDYLQYPYTEAFSMLNSLYVIYSTSVLPVRLSHIPLAFPRLGFPTLNLAAPTRLVLPDVLHSPPRCLPCCLDMLKLQARCPSTAPPAAAMVLVPTRPTSPPCPALCAIPHQCALRGVLGSSTQAPCEQAGRLLR